MNHDKHRDTVAETTMVRYVVIYVLVAWATLVIPLLLGHRVLVALLCAAPIGLAGVWFVALIIFRKDGQDDSESEPSAPAYEYRKL